jgi:hypothetical protein
MTIRTTTGSIQRYGCTRRWRRGPSVCTNGMLVRRDVAEAQIAALVRTKLYSIAAVDRLVTKVNARLRAQAPTAAAERGRLLDELRRVSQQLDGFASSSWKATPPPKSGPGWPKPSNKKRGYERSWDALRPRFTGVRCRSIRAMYSSIWRISAARLRKAACEPANSYRGTSSRSESTRSWTRRSPLPGPRSSAPAKGFWTV